MDMYTTKELLPMPSGRTNGRKENSRYHLTSIFEKFTKRVCMTLFSTHAKGGKRVERINSCLPKLCEVTMKMTTRRILRSLSVTMPYMLGRQNSPHNTLLSKPLKSQPVPAAEAAHTDDGDECYRDNLDQHHHCVW